MLDETKRRQGTPPHALGKLLLDLVDDARRGSTSACAEETLSPKPLIGLKTWKNLVALCLIMFSL